MMHVNCIETVEHLDIALSVLGEFDAQEAKANADLDQALRQTRENHAHRFDVRLNDGSIVPITEARANLKELIQDFSELHRRELLEPGKKSLECVHGTIGWRKHPDSIKELQLDQDQASALVKSGLIHKCLGRLLELCIALPLKLGKMALSECLSINVNWDKKKLKQALEAKKVTAAQLRRQGLEFVEGIDHFFCEAKSEKRPAT